MANVVAVQTLIDGPRNVVMKLTGLLDTSNESATLKVDVSTLGQTPTAVRIDKINYSISDQLNVQLYWDATTDLLIVPLAGRGEINAKQFGGLQNNAGAGKTGDIWLATTGWASGTQSYEIILEMVKQGVTAVN